MKISAEVYRGTQCKDLHYGVNVLEGPVTSICKVHEV